MCGEIDERDSVDEELFDRFLELVGHYGVSLSTPANDGPTRLTGVEMRTAYMNGLFKAGLTRALNDAVNLPRGERMDALAGQAIVFARLAGFLAGQFPPEADQFRTIVAALTQGYSEPDQIV